MAGDRNTLLAALAVMDSARTLKTTAPSFGDDEDEPTRVLDWDRATRKSIEREADPVKPGKK